MTRWEPQTPEQERIRRVAFALMHAENKSTKPTDLLAFFDPFNWSGVLTTAPGAHVADDIINNRPAWTAPRIIRMAVAAIDVAAPVPVNSGAHMSSTVRSPQPSTSGDPETPCPSPFDMGVRAGVANCQPIIDGLLVALKEVRDGADGRHGGEGMGDGTIVSIADDAMAAARVALAGLKDRAEHDADPRDLRSGK